MVYELVCLLVSRNITDFPKHHRFLDSWL